MRAENYEEGTQFKNIHTNHIWEVIYFGDVKVFIDNEYGDVSDYLDEDNFVEL